MLAVAHGRARCPGVHWTVTPTEPRSTTTLVGAARGRPCRGRRRSSGGRHGDARAGAAPRRARSGRWRSRPRRRRRPARGGPGSRSSRVTIAVTCALSARPLPVTAALTSVGVCRATGMPRWPAMSRPMAAACAVPIAVRTLCWLKTRSMAIASGANSSTSATRPAWTAARRCSMGRSGSVRMTPMWAALSVAPGRTVDDRGAAAGQAGIDAQDAHRHLPLAATDRPNTCSEG